VVALFVATIVLIAAALLWAEIHYFVSKGLNFDDALQFGNSWIFSEL